MPYLYLAFELGWTASHGVGRWRRGLDQARQGQLVKAPDMGKARKLAERIPDDE